MCETSVWKGGGNVSVRGVSKRDVDKGRRVVYADMRSKGDGFRREEILEGREMGVRTSAKVIVCADEVAENGVLAIIDRT